MIRTSQQIEHSGSPALSQRAAPVVLVAADENYVRPLAVTLLSAAQSLRVGRDLRVVVLDGGISDDSWDKLRASLAGHPVSIQAICPDAKEVQDLVTSHHISHTAYFRLLAARLLPDDIDKVIYLDSDVLVRGDLTELWKADLGNHACLAATDIACPFIHARSADRRFRRSIPYLASLTPIPNWKELGLNPRAAYFNSGVMVLNLALWREEQIDRQLLACLRNNRKHVWCWDQYALNVVFAGRWGQLPSRWNQGAHVYEFPDRRCYPIEADEFQQLFDDPAIIHYTTEYKPWLYRPFHPQRERFFELLDQTQWRGWRPQKPPFDLVHEWNQFAAAFVRRWTILWRKATIGLS